MSPRRSALPAGAVVAVLLALVAAGVVVVMGRQVDHERAVSRAARSTAESLSSVTDALRSKIADAEVLGSSGVAGTDLAPPEGVSESAATLARDTGHPVLDESGVVVVALYDTGAVPATSQERRDHVVGYRTLPLDLADTVGPLTPDHGGITVSGPTETILSVPRPEPASAASFTAPLSDDLAPGWSLTVWTPRGRVPSSAWLVAAVLLAIGAGFAGWLTLRQRDLRRRQTELDAFQRTSEAVAVLATLAQQSLDLGEALPGVTTELATVLGLSGLAVTTPGAAGERPIFAWGVPAVAGAPYQDQTRLPAGQSLSFVLSQGGRTVARLTVTAGRDLSRHDIRTLVAASDVLTSALANAEAFAQQAELIRRMRAVDELKSAFLATASHELRTPVAAITGYASLLHTNWEQLAPEESRDFAGRLDAVAQRLARLVEEILDFSRLESGKGATAETARLDLAETVELILAEQTELAPEHQVVHLDGPGLLVDGSRQAVERVVMNLVGNAAKYSPPGSTIRIHTRDAGERAELVVEDEGPGIPAAERGQVFAAFYRGQGTEVVRTRGVGLGLAIASEFAASMRGQIRVEEAPSGGASFVVSYPKAMSEAEPDLGAAHVQA